MGPARSLCTVGRVVDCWGDIVIPMPPLPSVTNNAGNGRLSRVNSDFPNSEHAPGIRIRKAVV